jgi:superfamily II DNA/RNA helicase
MAYSYRSAGASARARRPGRQNFSNNRPRPASRGGGNRQYIDPSRFVKAATPTVQTAYHALHKFSDFALNPLLQRNLIGKGFTVPTPIQDQAIPVALTGQDVIGIASTGTGKTTAFALPLLERLMANRRESALIIAPTRELAQQIEAECRALAKDSGLFGTVLIGGTNMGGQLRDLRRHPNVIIGTPGRIKDHLERGSLRLDTTTMVVLDEVDRMLDMGFVHDVTEILEHTPSERQSLFFSATMDARVRDLIQRFTTNPVSISLQASAASDNVHQDVVRYQSHGEKLDKLHDILLQADLTKAIVFEETQRSVERISQALIERGFQADAIHGGKSQGQRQRALDKFKKNEIRILVATDVAARGIDVADVSHVINYSVPKMYDDYIHRIGRAGRAGKIGYALTFLAH